MQNDFIRREANIFGRYILKKQPNDYCIFLYEQAMQRLNISLDSKEKRILKFILKNIWSIGMIDASLAMFDRNSQIRKKIFVMLAILETSPDYCEYFIPNKASPLYIIYIYIMGCKAILKALAGRLLLKLI